MLTTLVLLFHFAAPEDEALAIQMQPELEALLAQSELRAQIRLDSGSSNHGAPDGVAYVDVIHSCRPAFVSTTGVLARAQAVDGVILPLIEIDCAKVATYIRSNADLPRALARITAHGLFHYVLQESGHAWEGILQPSLSRWDLTKPVAELY